MYFSNRGDGTIKKLSIQYKFYVTLSFICLYKPLYKGTYIRLSLCGYNKTYNIPIRIIILYFEIFTKNKG